ncbi:sphingosine kinase and enzymes related to eukaryotic diacylglycerol kinase [Eubacterium sp. CAG:786]|nr:sphingosine kinase and enzymes related to eukaryotic diacylglycerol kinase [Eubacterium sp. CAG:786]
MTYALYNPFAGNQTCEEQSKKLREFYSPDELEFRSMADINYSEFFPSLNVDDKVIICGGDGTLNRFVNDTRDIAITNDILYYAAGSGNDFLRDLGKEKGTAPFKINQYIGNLPSVTVNGRETLFINAVGFGIDGYCCEVGDEMRKKSNGKPVNYTSIAIKGLLYAFRPTDATVVIDGKEKRYKKVWIAPTMHGRFYGGGMIAAPDQRRDAPDGKFSVVIWHGSNKLKTLMVFPSIFKGEHVKHSECIDIVRADEVTVKFDKPCALQIDGETILNVTEYSARSSAKVRAERSVTNA